MPLMGISYKKETFAARLKKLYEGEPDHSFAKLGKIAAGKGGKALSAQGAQKWVTGKAVPTPDKLRNIAKHYGVTREWLLFGDSPKRPTSMDIAAAADLLPEDDVNDLAKYALRLLEGCKPTSLGPEHDRFAASLAALSAVFRKHVQ
jgi:hypothetical protein